MIDDDSTVDPDATTGVAPTDKAPEPEPPTAWSDDSGVHPVNTGEPQPEPQQRSWAVPVALGIVALAGASVIGFATTVAMRAHSNTSIPASVHPVNTSTVTSYVEPMPPSTVTETSTEPPVTAPPTTVTVSPRPPAQYNPPDTMPTDQYTSFDQEFLARLRNVPGFVITDPPRLVWWGRHTCGVSEGGPRDVAAAEHEMMRDTGANLATTKQILGTAELVYPGCGAGV